MFFGLVFITIGLVFLLNSLGIISGDVWNIIWPCLFIIIGLSMIIRDAKNEKKWKCFASRVERGFEEK